MAREAAGDACPRDLLHAQEYPVLNGLPPIGEGGILGPDPVVKETKIPWTTPSTNARIPRVQYVEDGTPVGDAQDDRLRLRAQVVGVVGPP